MISKINVALSSVVISEIIDKISDSWYLFLLLVELILLLASLFSDIVKSKGKVQEEVKVEYLKELNEFGKDLRNYYDARKDSSEKR